MDKRRDFEPQVPPTQPNTQQREPTEFSKTAPQQPIGQAQPAPATTGVKAPEAYAMQLLQGSKRYNMGDVIEAGDLHGLVENVHFTFSRGVLAGLGMPQEAPKPLEGGGARKAMMSIQAGDRTYQVGEMVPEEHLKGLTPGVHVE